MPGEPLKCLKHVQCFLIPDSFGHLRPNGLDGDTRLIDAFKAAGVFLSGPEPDTAGFERHGLQRVQEGGWAFFLGRPPTLDAAYTAWIDPRRPVIYLCATCRPRRSGLEVARALTIVRIRDLQLSGRSLGS